jgi:hypothetical protein
MGIPVVQILLEQRDIEVLLKKPCHFLEKIPKIRKTISNSKFNGFVVLDSCFANVQTQSMI